MAGSASPHALASNTESVGQAKLVGLLAGQQVAEVGSIGDSAARKSVPFASLEERQSPNRMRSVRSFGAPLRPQMCQPGEQASSSASQLPKSLPSNGHPHHLPVRVFRKSPELAAELEPDAHPAMSGYLAGLR